MDNQLPRCLFLGYGYVARAIVAHNLGTSFEWQGTSRTPDKADSRQINWDQATVQAALSMSTHLLISVSPGAGHVQALQWVEQASAPHLHWLGYLSSTAIYGDHAGAWVDETTPASPIDERGRARLAAEQDWNRLAEQAGAASYCFRLAGIYGKGRNPLEQLKAGTARRIIKQDQVFSRVHVEDAASAIATAMQRPECAGIYNLADAVPAAASDVVAYAATLLGLPLPPGEIYDPANLSPMMQSFYAANRRVNGEKIYEVLNINRRYAGYEQGLKALAEAAPRV